MKTLLPISKQNSGLLATAHSSAIDAIRSNKNQLSGLVKQCGEFQVDAAIIVLLNEVFELTASPIKDLSGMATMIRKNFILLRFEEVVFALNKGINGGYGKVFGHLSYVQISEWLNIYMDTDRAEAVDLMAMERQGEKKAEMKTPCAPDSAMAQLINVYHTQKEEVKLFKPTPEKLRLTLENYDRGYLKTLMARQDEITTDELYKIQSLATESGYKFTCEHVADEIERRENA